jgi:hypothetical protein
MPECRLSVSRRDGKLSIRIRQERDPERLGEYTMDMTSMHTNHQLDAHDGLLLRNAGGRTVTCVSGSVWLTMQGDIRDVVLASGDSFAVDRDGLTILAAQQPSLVRVSAENRPRTWWDRVVDYLCCR